MLVHIGGFSACSCGGEVGSGCCRCYRKCPSSGTAGLRIHPGYYDGWDAREGAKKPHCWYCRRDGRMLRQKSEGSTPVRLLCHLKSMLPLQTEVLPATHRPDFTWLPWRALERQFPPLHSLLTYQLLHLCSNRCALHQLNSGDGKGNWS